MRAKENKLHFIYYFYLNIYSSILNFAPSFTMLLYLLAQIARLQEISSRNAYVVFSYLNMLINPLLNLPMTIRYCIQAASALKRLDNFFDAD